MTARNIPLSEVQALTRIVLQTYAGQYQRVIDPSTVTPSFIQPRTSTLIGFQLSTILDGRTLKLRIYASNFTLAPGINPFRLEDRQNQENGLGIQVFVSISDLPVAQFPILSKTVNPNIDNSVSPFAIELEDGSGFIQAETGEVLLTEAG